MTELDTIWPEISAAIGRARTLRRMRRAATLCLLALGSGAGLLFYGLPDAGKPDTMRSSWTLAHVTTPATTAAAYPLVEGDRLVVLRPREDGADLLCVNRTTGAVVWQRALAGTTCRLAVDDDRLYVLSADQHGIWTGGALSIESGAAVWSVSVDTDAGSEPSIPVAFGRSICWTAGNRVTCRDRDTGALRWQRELTTAAALCQPVHGAGSLFTVGDNTLYAIAADDGTVSERIMPAPRHAGLKPVYTLCASANRVYVSRNSGFYAGEIACYSTDLSNRLWSRALPAPARMTLADERLLVRADGLRAFDSTTGEPIWAADVGGCGTVACIDGRVYAVDAPERNAIVALDHETGQELGRHAMSASCSGVVVHDRMGYISTNHGLLHAVPLVREDRKRANQESGGRNV
jgi:outer membrane protein assembly factor BamB